MQNDTDGAARFLDHLEVPLTPSSPPLALAPSLPAPPNGRTPVTTRALCVSADAERVGAAKRRLRQCVSPRATVDRQRLRGLTSSSAP